MTARLLNIETGELCDTQKQSEGAFVDRAGTWQKVVEISEKAYNKLKNKEA